jgi:2-oxoisovalerate dehydrogenase E2 component (dihydrolipoyl transacylase)
VGRFVFKLPDVGEGTAEAEVVAWHAGVGDLVDEDAPLVDVMTDKATVEITSPVRGKILLVAAQPGEMATVGATLVELETEDEAAEEIAEAVAEVRPLHPEPAAAKVKPEPEAPVEAPRTPGAQAAPAVRARAEKLGLDLGSIRGSGPRGRITHEDLDAAMVRGGSQARAPARSAAPPRDDEQVKVMGLRRRIAEKMAEAKRRIPHFGYVEEVDVTELEALRRHLNATHPDSPRLTLLPFLMAAVVKAAAAYPQINARYDDDAGVVTRSGAVHIGIAVQTEAGLMVPVVRNAEARSLWDNASEIARLAAAARDGTAARDELSGSTITITSLGPLGGISHFPVINHPEVAILGPNKIVERPVVRHGQVVVRQMMNVSSAFDHRVVDGQEAAEFIQRIKALLEHPASLFVD